MELDDMVFKFEFSSFKTKNKNMNYVVYAKNRHDMDMFLKQHGFLNNSINVECFPMIEFEGNDDLIIKPHKFKSNNSDELFTIYTPSRFVEEAMDSVCSEMSDALVIGEPITRRDIEIIKTIEDLMTSLDHVVLLDFTMMDNDETYLVHEFAWEYMKSYERIFKDFDCGPLCSLDDSYIYDSIMNKYSTTDVVPITIEGYVSYFTYLLTDIYE